MAEAFRTNLTGAGGTGSTITFSNIGGADVRFLIGQAIPDPAATLTSQSSAARLLDLSVFTSTTSLMISQKIRDGRTGGAEEATWID